MLPRLTGVVNVGSESATPWSKVEVALGRSAVCAIGVVGSVIEGSFSEGTAMIAARIVLVAYNIEVERID